MLGNTEHRLTLIVLVAFYFDQLDEAEISDDLLNHAIPAVPLSVNRMILAIPDKNTTSERVFSVACRTLEDQSSQTKKDTVD